MKTYKTTEEKAAMFDKILNKCNEPENLLLFTECGAHFDIITEHETAAAKQEKEDRTEVMSQRTELLRAVRQLDYSTSKQEIEIEYLKKMLALERGLIMSLRNSLDQERKQK